MAQIDDVLRALRERGLSFQYSNGFEAQKARAILGIGEYFHSIYDKFNGFCEYDSKNYMKLWSYHEIMDKNIDSNIDNWIVIGDFLMNSDLIAVRKGVKQADIKLLYEDKWLALDILSFLEKMSIGEFDFVS